MNTNSGRTERDASPEFRKTSLADSPYRVLAVDDMLTNRELVLHALKSSEFEVQLAASGDEALEILASRPVDVVLLDIMMPGMDGFEVCKSIRENPDLRFLPVIMVTSLGHPDDLVHGMEVGADDYVAKPFNAIELIARVRSAAERKRVTDHLDDTESVLFSLARMVEARDEDTGDHCDRLSHMSVVFGQALGLPYEDLVALRRGGVLHDIGKLGIPDSILLKKGPLDEPEWAVMRQHPAIGAALCSPLRTMRKTVDIIQYHHERWDGSGYPHGLRGSEIPLLARVFQIVDIYDALVSARPYKVAFSPEKAVEIMEAETAKGWRDPDLMKVFLDIVCSRGHELSKTQSGMQDKSAEFLRKIIGLGAHGWYKQEPKNFQCMVP